MNKQLLGRFCISRRRRHSCWLALAICLACESVQLPGLADEPQTPPALLNLDREDLHIFETPFGKARGPRTNAESVRSPFSDVTEADDAIAHESNTPSDQSTQRVRHSVPLTKSATARSSSLPRNNEGSTRNATFTPASWNSAAAWFVLISIAFGLGIKWLGSRRTTSSRTLPDDVFEVLGRLAVDSRLSVTLVRCGSRLLLLGASPTGLQTLSEITDPVEVDCLAGLCRSAPRDHALTETFRSLLNKPAVKRTSQDLDRSSALGTTTEPRFSDRIMASRSLTPGNAEVRP